LLAPAGIKLTLQAAYNTPEVAETGMTFIENALLKARNACQYSKLPAIADDSGLLVDSLQGEPGLYSARYAGAHATDQENIEKLLNKMLQLPPDSTRAAKFYCVIVLLNHMHDVQPKIFEAVWHGEILTKPQGSLGFGYDPIFWLPSHNCSAAELTMSQKNNISHRAQAMQQLIDYLCVNKQQFP